VWRRSGVVDREAADSLPTDVDVLERVLTSLDDDGRVTPGAGAAQAPAGCSSRAVRREDRVTTQPKAAATGNISTP
jgi:hypothetical protein